MPFGDWDFVPVPSTVRTGATLDMLWVITNPEGETMEQRLAVTGCAEGKGDVYMVNDDYSLVTAESFPWSSSTQLGAIALTMCQAAGG